VQVSLLNIYQDPLLEHKIDQYLESINVFQINPNDLFSNQQQSFKNQTILKARQRSRFFSTESNSSAISKRRNISKFELKIEIVSVKNLDLESSAKI